MTMPLTPHIFISVEGNTGAGKSTLARILSHTFDAYLIQEPFSTWTNVDGIDLFEIFQSDPQRWAYTFQSYAALTYLKELKKIDDCNSKKQVLISDRSPYTGIACFTPMFFDDKHIKPVEWNLYQETTRWLLTKLSFKPQGFIYLRTPPEVCYERNRKRNRQTRYPLELEFFKKLHHYHDAWLLKNKNDTLRDIPVLMLDGSLNFDEDLTVQSHLIQAVKNFIENIRLQQSDATHNCKRNALPYL